MWRDGILTRIEALEHPAWGPEHCRRLYATARGIANSEGLDFDDDVLFAVSWLHDIGTFGQFSCDAETPPECAALAAEHLLPEVAFPAEKTATVARIIREHSFEGDDRPTTEAKVLRDADMLEFLGAIGLIRLLSIVETEDWVPEPKAAISLALDFAEQLPGKLFYETSRMMADERVAETTAFVDALGAETADLVWL